jgi:hypothetical protein
MDLVIFFFRSFAGFLSDGYSENKVVFLPCHFRTRLRRLDPDGYGRCPVHVLPLMYTETAS